MKKILLSILCLTLSCLAFKSYSQVGGCLGGPNNCSIAVSNTVVTVKSSVTNPNNASQILVTFDVAFDLSYNNGNTDFFINSFLSADYPNPAYWPCGNGNHPAPTNGLTTGKLGTARDQVQRSFLDIELANPARGAVGVPVNMTIATTYQYDASVVLTSPANSPGMTATKVFLSGTTDRVTITNATAIINATLNTPIVVKTDVWAQNGNAHCYQAGITQAFNDPSIGGFKNCDFPRRYTLGITTTSTTPTTLTYSVWIDNNSNGIIDAGDVQAVGPTAYANFSSSNPFSTNGPVTYPGGGTPIIGEKDLIISAQTPLIANAITKVFAQPQGCIGLPVNFTYFQATRNGSNVLVKWETATEQNNTGFAIERNINGTWQQVAFIPSQASGGNSDMKLTYSFVDLNSTKGISQYRIKQIDIDSKSKYTEVRAVRGDGQTGKTIIYPNPTNDGKINIVFEDAGTVTRNISVLDMSGRLIKQINGVANNNLQIEKLTPGMYSVRVIIVESGQQSVDKIIVNK